MEGKACEELQPPSGMEVGGGIRVDLIKDVGVNTVPRIDGVVGPAKGRAGLIFEDFRAPGKLPIVMKMEISHKAHPHLIGPGGVTVQRLMEETGCRIHFPDSNRFFKHRPKSNRVRVSGDSVGAVEKARRRLRELSPFIFTFLLPCGAVKGGPQAHAKLRENMANFGIQVVISPPSESKTMVAVRVKCCEVDLSKIQEGISTIVRCLCGDYLLNNGSQLNVECAMDISPADINFARGPRDCNLLTIKQDTGAKIRIPDRNAVKWPRVFISGNIGGVFKAQQQLTGYLPLRIILELPDEVPVNMKEVGIIESGLNVTAKIKYTNQIWGVWGGGGASASVPFAPHEWVRIAELCGAERNFRNIYETGRRILRSADPPLYSYGPVTCAGRPEFTSEVGSCRYYNIASGISAPLVPPQIVPPPGANILIPVPPTVWGPHPLPVPFVHPSGSVYVNSGWGWSDGMHGSLNGDYSQGPPGFSNMQSLPSLSYSILSSRNNSGYGFGSNLSTPSQIFSLDAIASMKQGMDLQPMMYRNQGVEPSTASSSRLTDGSPPLKSTVHEFPDYNLMRKAPGWERQRQHGRSMLASAMNGGDESPRSKLH